MEDSALTGAVRCSSELAGPCSAPQSSARALVSRELLYLLVGRGKKLENPQCSRHSYSFLTFVIMGIYLISLIIEKLLIFLT